MLIAKYADEDDDIQAQQTVFEDILKLLDFETSREGIIDDWLQGVSDADTQASMMVDHGDEVDDGDDANETTNELDAIHDDEWLDDEDRRDMGQLLGWFEGFGEGVRDGMVRVNGRQGRERRMGGVFV